jgi:hypothetical protein
MIAPWPWHKLSAPFNIVMHGRGYAASNMTLTASSINASGPRLERTAQYLEVTFVDIAQGLEALLRAKVPVATHCEEVLKQREQKPVPPIHKGVPRRAA